MESICAESSDIGGSDWIFSILVNEPKFSSFRTKSE